MLHYVFLLSCNVVLIIFPLLIAVAYLTLLERKFIGAMQLRLGPNVTGPYGFGQPIADAIKLLSKEFIFPEKADKFLFTLAPILMFSLSMVGWAVIPIQNHVLANINLGVLYLLGVFSLSIYSVVIAGWSSGSTYSFLGAVRAAAQMISYELPMGMCLICVVLISGSLDLVTIAETNPCWQLELLMIPVCVIFFICTLAETNRHPFDLPEAEGELVGGYHVEYSSVGFALFFLAEYANMILSCVLTSIFFLGAWHAPFGIRGLEIIPGSIWLTLKVSFCIMLFITIRASLPRYRYDQLMILSWKYLLPITFLLVINIAIAVTYL